MLNINAVQNVSTTKPPTIFVQSKIIKAFITNKNKPSVTNVTGRVSNTRIGLMKIFSNPKTTATITAVPKLATWTPVKMFDNNKTKAAVTRSLSNYFITFSFKFLIKVMIFYLTVYYSEMVSE